MAKNMIRPPFFEVGPKVYQRGDEAVRLACAADVLSEKYSVDIIYTAQYTDIRPIAEKTKNIKVFAQHMDFMPPGRGLGGVLPEALVDAGASGVMLNHTEKPLTLAALHKTIQRARQVGLTTIVCADTPEEAQAIAHLGPDMILAESPELIGGTTRSDEDNKTIARVNACIADIDPAILVMHSAGIKDDTDVYHIIRHGAQATGSTSGILCAPDPFVMLEKMIKAVRDAWNEREDDSNARLP